MSRWRDMRRLLAISVLGATMLIFMVVMAVALLGTPSGELEGDFWFVVILFLGLWLYWGLGTLIVMRANGHVVGWLFAVAATMMATVSGCFGLSVRLGSSQPPALDAIGNLSLPLAAGLGVAAIVVRFGSSSVNPSSLGLWIRETRP